VSLSQGSSVSPSIPMPPRHPHPQGQGRGRTVISHSTSSSSAAAAAALASLSIYSNQVVAFPTSSRQRADGGPARSGQQEMLYEDSDLEGQIEFNEEDLEVEEEEEGEEEEDENGEHASLALECLLLVVAVVPICSLLPTTKPVPELTHCTPARVHAILPRVRVHILHIPLPFVNMPTP